jgi:hypothetical protein
VASPLKTLTPVHGTLNSMPSGHQPALCGTG